MEYWSGLPFPPPGDLPDSAIEPGSPVLQADSLPLSRWRSPVSSHCDSKRRYAQTSQAAQDVSLPMSSHAFPVSHSLSSGIPVMQILSLLLFPHKSGHYESSPAPVTKVREQQIKKTNKQTNFHSLYVCFFICLDLVHSIDLPLS